jgi:opacity protein-like surface antigen
MKSYLFGAVSVLSLIAAGSASAHDDDGWYLRGNAGYGIHHDAEVSGLIDSSLHGNGLQSEGNGAFSLGAGYDFGDHWRVELDADSLNSSLGSISQTPGSKASLLTETVMLNALYDFDDFGNWQPYVGAGVGLVKGKANLSAHDFPGIDNELVRNVTCVGARAANQASSCAVSDSDTGFGWQLLAGLGYKISDNLTWDSHYTYLDGPDLDLNGHIANGDTGAFDLGTANLTDVGAHTLMTGLRYTFGHSHSEEIVAPPAPTPTFKCWNGDMVFNSGQCAVKEVIAPPAPRPTKICWDGSTIDAASTCPVEPAPQPAPEPAPTYTCWDGTVTYDLNTCPVQPQPEPARANLNLCGESSVAIFNVPVNSTPKQMSRLGTMPEFGDSHGLTPDQFFNKLNARYNDNATDKAYLNYLFKSMGYSNGWADAQSYMFSEEVLPVGTPGLLGLGKQHHFEYSILPTNERDRQAFRIQSANGSVVHFMKTCGNYMYACE